MIKDTIISTIIFTLVYTAIFYKIFKSLPDIYTYLGYIMGIGSILLGKNILIEELNSRYPFTMPGWMMIGAGVIFIGIIIHRTYQDYYIKKNTAEVVERFVTGVVKTKNSRTNIRTVNNKVTSSEQYHTVIKLDCPDVHDNFIDFYDYNTFMTVSEGEKVNLKNVRKLDKNGKILDSTFWIV